MKKTCVVTGGTSGIGFATSYQLAEEGCVVIVVGRNAEKCKVITEKIKKSTGNTNIHYVVGDISLKKDVLRIAKSLSKFEINVLINNAGCIMVREEKTSEGIEKTFALNHLGYFLLANLLLDNLRQNTPSRIINLSSEAHRFVSLPLETIENEKDFSLSNIFKVYGRSKLCNLLFTYELAKRLDSSNITVNAFHPGIVATKLFSSNGFKGKILNFFLGLASVGNTPNKPAANLVYLALDEAVSEMTGKYIIGKNAVKSSDISYQSDLQKELWNKSESITGMKFPVTT